MAQDCFPEADAYAEQYMRMALVMARRFGDRFSGGFDRLLLEEAALEELVRCLRRYDPERGVPVRSWIARRVRFACVEEVRRVLGRFGTRPYERPFSVFESDRGMMRTAASGAVTYTGGTKGDDPFRDSLERDPRTLERDVCDQVADAELVEMARAIAVRGTPRQAEVFELIYRKGRLQEEVATELGITPGRVSQLHTRVIARIRQDLCVA